MKHYYYLALAMCLMGYSYGQTSPQRVELKKLEPAKSTVVTSSNTPNSSSDSLSGMTVQHCQSVIDAIDAKVAYVQSDQVENEKALANGWYDRMAKNRRDWVADRDELIRRANTPK